MRIALHPWERPRASSRGAACSQVAQQQTAVEASQVEMSRLHSHLQQADSLTTLCYCSTAEPLQEAPNLITMTRACA